MIEDNLIELKREKLRIEIDAVAIERMIESGILSASDMRCLNCESKKCVWNMCLKICSRRMKSTDQMEEIDSLCTCSNEKDQALLHLMRTNLA